MKYFFKLKQVYFGEILKYKANLVVYRYRHEETMDYLETFPAVVKSISYKCLLVAGLKRRYRIRHMDVVTVFLYEFWNETIHIEQPHLYITRQGLQANKA